MTNHRRWSRRAAIWIAVPVLFCLLASPALAVEHNAARKVGRGLAAMTTAFLEVPGNIVKISRERSPVWGFTLGFGIGLGKIVPRNLVGVYEFLTAPFPAPPGYEPMLEPEFPWGYFEEPRPRR